MKKNPYQKYQYHVELKDMIITSVVGLMHMPGMEIQIPPLPPCK